ncbi:hypothetical protein FHS43_005999 [Streptosporangium becharense]|uniref:Uncharacterized protein n=1 Tax=Streptosporangium becharense TaxID=1816182 RepID=A0A7W9IHQ2_9ACTN|nr:hypothetical protein [Streptosporangium becharense]MBB2914687.1 hypothetical protein [Streptosporangium becharense]MBB5820912.1 hypothetical protein [Streptosporangium becharense]
MSDQDAPGGSGVLDLLERIGSVVLPVGIALYALLYLGIQQVYGVFNVSPEQAGIDQATMFGRLVGCLVLLVLGGALVIGALVAAGWLADKVTGGRLARLTRAVRERAWAAAVLGAVWCGATYWGFLGYLGLAEGVELLSIVLVATGIGVVAFLVPFRLLRRRSGGRAGMKIMIAAFTGIGLGFALIGQMESDAVRLATTGRGSIVLSLVGFQEQWVVAATPGKGVPLRGGVSLLLLGEHDGTYSFYDCARQETFRRPTGATALHQVVLEPDREEGFTCDDLVPEPAASPAQ